MGIRAKFCCLTVTKDSAKTEIVQLHAVTSNSEDNKSWSKWTPAGALSMTISNPEAQGYFEPGKEYFLDISEVAK